MGLFRPKRHTDRVGDISEAAIATRLLQAGYVVLTPYGKQHRYDLVIEDAEARFCESSVKRPGSCKMVRLSRSTLVAVTIPISIAKAWASIKEKITGGRLNILLLTVRPQARCTSSR